MSGPPVRCTHRYQGHDECCLGRDRLRVHDRGDRPEEATMKPKPVRESDAWYPAPQLTAPERAMLDNAIALGFPPAPRRAERSGEGTEVVGVEPCARAPTGTVLTGAELSERPTEAKEVVQPAALVRPADGTSHTMRICAALLSDAGTPIAETKVIPDRAMSAETIAAVISDGYGRGGRTPGRRRGERAQRGAQRARRGGPRARGAHRGARAAVPARVGRGELHGANRERWCRARRTMRRKCGLPIRAAGPREKP